MIRREDLKHAIDDLARLDPGAGAALDRLLATGRLVPAPSPEAGGDPGFLLDGAVYEVRRRSLFEHGVRVLAERLVVAAGEFRRRRELEASRPVPDPMTAAGELGAAGAAALVDHALRAAGLDAPPGGEEGDAAEIYSGAVGFDTPAAFVPFPFDRRSLLEVARRNLEFFDLATVLAMAPGRRGPELFAARVRGEVLGLISLGSRSGPAGVRPEIRALATVAGGASSTGRPAPRGVGAFLVAGVWLLLRERAVRTPLELTSELGALGFYESAGAERVRDYDYRLRRPAGHVLRNVVAMVERKPDVGDAVLAEVERAVVRHARRRAAAEPETPPARLETALFFEECFRCRRRPRLARLAARELVAAGGATPLADALLRSARELGLVRRRGEAPVADPVLVVLDDRFAGHLETVLSLENGRRLAAIREVLAADGVAGRWREVPARPATEAELLLVHTPEHVARIAATAGCDHTILAGDTEATARSFDAARLAVGGLVELLDAVLAGEGRRGFAFVRPPGHHAEPDRPGGFCLFNNVAIGARHLIDRRGLPRVMILDLDAHHGNGTQRAFWGTDRVLYASVHRRAGFPGTGGAEEAGEGAGEGATVNVPVDGPLEEAGLTAALDRLFLPVGRRYRPAFLLVSLGFDLYPGDPVGRMRVGARGYAFLAGRCVSLAEEVADGRVVFVLEGGYRQKGIRECGRAVMRVLAGEDPPPPVRERSFPGLVRAIRIHADRWNLEGPDRPRGVVTPPPGPLPPAGM